MLFADLLTVTLLGTPSQMIFRDLNEMSSNIFYTSCYKEHAIVFIGVP